MRRGATPYVIMIDTVREQLLPLRKVPDYLAQRGAKRPHVSACHRWALAGLQGIRLETVRIGGVLHTSVEAIDRWTRALTVGGGVR